MPNFGAILSNIAAPLANTVASHNFADIAERDKQRQQAMQQLALQRQASIDSDNAALNKARIGNYQSMSNDRSFKEDADPIVAHQIAQDGTPYNIRKSGNWEKATIGGGPPAPNGPVSSPSTGPNFTKPADLTSGLRQNLGLQPQTTQAPKVNGPTGNIDLGQPDQGPTPPPPQTTAPAPKFGKPPVVPKATSQEQVAARVRELVGQKVPLAKANEQARAEFGLAPPQPGGNVYVTGADSTGAPKIFAGSTKGPPTLTPTGVSAKPTGQAGAQVEKEKTFVDMMESSLPTMQALAHKVRPAAITAAALYPNAGNTVLNPDEQKFLQSARTFIAGTLHQESGARLSKEQWQIGLERYLPTVGDYDATVDQKISAAAKATTDRRAQVNAAGGGRGGSNPGQTPPAAPSSGAASVAAKYGIRPSGDE